MCSQNKEFNNGKKNIKLLYHVYIEIVTKYIVISIMVSKEHICTLIILMILTFLQLYILKYQEKRACLII